MADIAVKVFFPIVNMCLSCKI